jgi:acetoacetyl-CoA synthetase
MWLPFDHPIWIVYSSGTTGLPKPIVHGHGGIILTMHACGLHNDVGCSYGANNFGERYHWYSSTGWVMWNAQLSGLLRRHHLHLRRQPGGSKEKPDWTRAVALRRATLGVTFFGAGAAYFTNCMKAGSSATAATCRACARSAAPARRCPKRCSAGARAADPGAGSKEVWWCNISGGTDFAAPSSAATASCPKCRARCSAACSACAVEAWNEQGQPVIGEVGELVCTRPFRRCRCTSGTTKATRATCRATSTPTPACGATATG